MDNGESIYVPENTDILERDVTLDEAHHELSSLNNTELLDRIEDSYENGESEIDRTLLISHARTRGYSFAVDGFDILICYEETGTVARHCRNALD